MRADVIASLPFQVPGSYEWRAESKVGKVKSARYHCRGRGRDCCRLDVVSRIWSRGRSLKNDGFDRHRATDKSTAEEKHETTMQAASRMHVSMYLSW